MEDTRFTDLDHYFHREYLTDEQAEQDVAEVIRLLGLPRGSRILDAGCGDGRLSVRLAAQGYSVTGVDHDSAQLDRLNQRAHLKKVSVESVLAGLESFTGDEPFDGALLWFTTWGFSSDEVNEQILARLRGSLTVGAPLVIDTLNPLGVIDYLKAAPEPVITRQGDDTQIDTYSFDPKNHRFTSNRVTQVDGINDERELKLWVPDLEIWSRLLNRHGFILESVHGHGLEEWTPETWEMVVSARSV